MPTESELRARCIVRWDLTADVNDAAHSRRECVLARTGFRMCERNARADKYITLLSRTEFIPVTQFRPRERASLFGSISLKSGRFRKGCENAVGIVENCQEESPHWRGTARSTSSLYSPRRFSRGNRFRIGPRDATQLFGHRRDILTFQHKSSRGVSPRGKKWQNYICENRHAGLALRRKLYTLK